MLCHDSDEQTYSGYDICSMLLHPLLLGFTIISFPFIKIQHFFSSGLLNPCRQSITMTKQSMSVFFLLLAVLAFSLPREIRGQGGAVTGAQAGAAGGAVTGAPGQAGGRCPGSPEVCVSNVGCTGCVRKLGEEIVCWTGKRSTSAGGDMCFLVNHPSVLCKNLACA